MTDIAPRSDPKDIIVDLIEEVERSMKNQLKFNAKYKKFELLI